MQDVNNQRLAYRDLLIRANKRQNLIARGNVQNLFDKLFIESLLPLNWDLCNLKSPLLDIGTGAGFPGVPLKISLPDHCTTLLDSNRRKSLFLRNVIETLGLTDTNAVCTRAEEFVTDPLYIGHYNTIVSRAAASLADLILWGSELLKPGGEIIAWKGSSVGEELDTLDHAGFTPPELNPHDSGLVLIRLVKA